MVCLACLLPLFLVPIVNLLPLLFDFIMAKVYRLFGWEYQKPERAPPACPIKPSASKTGTNSSVTGKDNLAAPDPTRKSVEQMITSRIETSCFRFYIIVRFHKPLSLDGEELNW
ncbi:hypothetical protein Sango_2507600 [Sesamum angolense]|uniref:Uncharacterized protein n=1 Tax=Sesamum angolense TaxID=2727404 RepID=A0AAE1W3Z4_9LAMI|nr:hypothetical protein Sango_2507600 [Sesamum angolense]